MGVSLSCELNHALKYRSEALLVAQLDNKTKCLETDWETIEDVHILIMAVMGRFEKHAHRMLEYLKHSIKRNIKAKEKEIEAKIARLNNTSVSLALPNQSSENKFKQKMAEYILKKGTNKASIFACACNTKDYKLVEEFLTYTKPDVECAHAMLYLLRHGAHKCLTSEHVTNTLLAIPKDTLFVLEIDGRRQNTNLLQYCTVIYVTYDALFKLIDCGGYSLNTKIQSGKTTAMLYAMAFIQSQMAILFEKYKDIIDFTATDDEGNQMIHLICDQKENTSVELLKLVASKTPNLNAQNKAGRTPLMICRWHQSPLGDHLQALLGDTP